MKYVFFDCDKCFHTSTPAQTDKSARHKAIEEGFVFIKGKCFCSEHKSIKISHERNLETIALNAKLGVNNITGLLTKH